MMPLILASSSVSLGMVLYSRPLITPVAIIALYLYKHVKKPFGWGIRQVYGKPLLASARCPLIILVLYTRRSFTDVRCCRWCYH